jgi:hypothetical protein
MAFSTFNSFTSVIKEGRLKLNPVTSLLGTLITHYYKFDNGDISGNNIKNYLNNTYDCIQGTGSTISTTNFKVGNGSIYKPTATILPSFTLSSNAISVSFWIYPVTTKNYSCVFSFATAFNQWSTGLELQFLDNQLAFTKTSDSWNYIATSITLNTWLHVSCVIQSNGTWTNYYNGSLVGPPISTQWPGTQPYSYNHIGSQLNDQNTTASTPADYYLDDFRIYNGYALTAQNVTEIYNGTV